MKNHKESYKFKIVCKISIVALLIIFFMGSFQSLMYDKNFYNELYDKTGTQNRVENTQIQENTDLLMSYFKDKKEIKPGFFSEKEISHLNDVKKRINLGMILYYLSLGIIIASTIFIYKYEKDSFNIFLKKILFYSGLLSLVIILIFFLFSFSWVFELFHKVFFTDNYLFDPSSGLIKMFNENFFYLFAKQILVKTSIKGIIAFIMGGFLMYYKK